MSTNIEVEGRSNSLKLIIDKKDFLVGSLIEGARNIGECSGLNTTVRGFVNIYNGDDEALEILAYVKPEMDIRTVFIEYICAKLGRRLGIPIPRPVLVYLTSDSWKNIPAGETRLGFGSEAVDAPPFYRFFKEDNSYLQKLRESKPLFNVIIFDEWIHNHDRHMNNYLYDGVSEFYFFDHDNAIPKHCSPILYLVSNKLHELTTTDCSADFLLKLKRKVKPNIIDAYKQLEILHVVEHELFREFLTPNDISQILNILTNRIDNILLFAQKRFGILQQQELL